MGGTAVADPLVGSMLGKDYRVLEQLGMGGMAVVYLVEHQTLLKRFAAKVLSSEHASSVEARARFMQEAHAASQLDHENIVSISDFGVTADQRPYFVMELLRGKTLAARLDEGPMSLEEVVAVSVPVARALAHAHAEGIIHRDVKPENIFLVQRSQNRWSVKMLDFGIAKVPFNDRMTKTGQALGSPAFMSPEACKGDDVDQRADVYSFGILLYLMLAGRVPFEDTNLLKVLQMQVSTPLPLPSSFNAELPPSIEAVIIRALAKDPDDRYPTMEAMLLDFEAALPNGADLMLLQAQFGVAQTPFPGSLERVRNSGLFPAAVTGQHAITGRQQAARDTPMPAAPPSAPSRGRGKLVVVGLSVLVLAGAGAGAYAYLGHREVAASALDPAPVAAPVPTPGPAPVPVEQPAVARVEPPAAVDIPVEAAPTVAADDEPAPDEPRAPSPSQTKRAGTRPAKSGRGGGKPATAKSAAKPVATAAKPGTTAAKPVATAKPVITDAKPAAGSATASTLAGSSTPAGSSPSTTPAGSSPSTTSAGSAAPVEAAKPAPAQVTKPTPAQVTKPAPTQVAAATVTPVPTATTATPVPTAPAVTPKPVGSLDATPSIASLDVSGSLPTSAVQRGIERVLPALRECYRAAAKAQQATPPLTLSLSFEVDESSAARNVTVKASSFGSLASCAKGALGRVQTRQAPDVGTVHVVVGMKFTPI